MPVEAAPSFLLVEGLPEAGGRVTLSAEESHYLGRVCRARPGDRATATDGRGALATVRLIAGGSEAVVEVETCDHAEPVRSAVLLCGPPEGGRGDWLVEKLAELGVGTFQPIDCERGGWERMKGRSDRWRRLAVAALRQSRRRQLLEIRMPCAMDAALAMLPSGGGRWFGDPAGVPAAALAPSARGQSTGLIGPAAGMAPVESGMVTAAGFTAISLSDGRLRTETAALAWACWWSAPRESGVQAI